MQIAECCNVECNWEGDPSQCITFKHGGPPLCPECCEVVEVSPVTTDRSVDIVSFDDPPAKDTAFAFLAKRPYALARYAVEYANKYKRLKVLAMLPEDPKELTRWHLQQRRMRELRAERKHIRQMFLDRGVFIKKQRPSRKHTKHKRCYGKIRILPYLIGEGPLTPWDEFESK